MINRRMLVGSGLTSGLTGILFLPVIRLPDALGPLDPYFGSILLLLAIAAVIAVGVVSLGFLSSRGWFEIYLGRECLRVWFLPRHSPHCLPLR